MALPKKLLTLSLSKGERQPRSWFDKLTMSGAARLLGQSSFEDKMPSRTDFLKTVRDALARGRAGAHAGDDASAELPPLAREEPERLHARLAGRRPQLLAQAAATAERQGWRLVRVGSRAEAAQAVAEIARSLGARQAVRTAHPVLETSAMDEVLVEAGVQMTLLAHDAADPAGSRRRLRELAARADFGLTGADYFVAETGSLVQVSRRGISRLASLLPPVHIAIAEAAQLVESLDDLLLLAPGDFHLEPGAPWYMNLISGPSRTGDIELTIVTGVHGPGEVYLVLVTSP